MSDYLDPNNEELLKDFFAEAELQVQTLEENVLALENDPTNREAVDEIFRAAHTLKGAAATVQMQELAQFTHLLEDVLDEIRNGSVKVTSEVVDTILESIDIIKDIMRVRGEGEVYSENIEGIVSRLNAHLPGAKKKDVNVGGEEKDEVEAEEQEEQQETGQASGLSEYELLELRDSAAKDENILRVHIEFNPDNPMNSVGGIQVFAALKEAAQILKTDPEFDKLYEDNFFPTVDYYISTKKEPSKIEQKVNIADVTDNITIYEITENGDEKDVTSSGKKEKTKEKKSTAKSEDAASGAEKGTEDKAPAGKSSTKKGGDAAAENQPQKKEEAEKPAEATGQEAQEKEEPEKAAKKQDKPSQSKQQVVGSILRVDSKRIDNLLNLVSETVINKATFNQLSLQFTEGLSELQNTNTEFRDRMKELFDALPSYLEQINDGKSVKEVKREITEQFGDLYTFFDNFENTYKGLVNNFRGTAGNLGRITGDLQEAVMRIRMVPISQIFSRFPRLVRDLSRNLNKKVNLEIEGEDTELDKSIIEDLLDPLIHCVRNSIDHGLELPEERKESGKEEEGTVYLRARNEGNMIIIEVEDDGKGIDIDSIRKKAIDRKLIHPNKVLSDLEAFNLIFEPGFSTSKKISNISGRGVGLDVVKKQIEKLNGSVSVWSEKGVGTKFTVKLPLTLAIIQGLLVRVGEEIYSIPITSVNESHRIKPQEIKMIDNYEVFNVREDVISLIRLNRLFRIPTGEQKDYYYVVIVGSGEKKMGIIVDSLIGEEDVVIKPLKDKYTKSPGIAGASVLGDGTVSLIIDVSQLLDLGLQKEQEKRKRRETTIS